MSLHLQWDKTYQNEFASSLSIVRVFCCLRMTKCCLSYFPIKLLGKTSDAQEQPSENKQESCKVEKENLMLSIDLRERTPSQHRVRQVKLYNSEKGNSLSIPQTFAGQVRWICEGDWTFGHRSRVSTPITGTGEQHHDSSLCAGMQLL